MLFLVQGANKLCANANVSLMSKFCTIFTKFGTAKDSAKDFSPYLLPSLPCTCHTLVRFIETSGGVDRILLKASAVLTGTNSTTSTISWIGTTVKWIFCRNRDVCTHSCQELTGGLPILCRHKMKTDGWHDRHRRHRIRYNNAISLAMIRS